MVLSPIIVPFGIMLYGQYETEGIMTLLWEIGGALLFIFGVIGIVAFGAWLMESADR